MEFSLDAESRDYIEEAVENLLEKCGKDQVCVYYPEKGVETRKARTVAEELKQEDERGLPPFDYFDEISLEYPEDHIYSIEFESDQETYVVGGGYSSALFDKEIATEEYFLTDSEGNCSSYFVALHFTEL